MATSEGNLFKFFCLCLIGLAVVTASNDDAYLVASIDCGTTGSYNDKLGITWIGDDSFVRTGTVATITTSNASSLPRRYSTLRFFASGRKNCYVIPGTTPLKKYLVRASFYYGNYDGKSSPPSFDLHLDGNEWDKVVSSVDKEAVHEVNYNATGTRISVCVAQTSPGQIPFISSLEVRSFLDSMYNIETQYALLTIARTAFGSPADVRYPDDPFDRIWYPSTPLSGFVAVTSDADAVDVTYWNCPPQKVMLQAITPSSPTATSMTIPLPVTAPVNVYRTLYYSEVSSAVAAVVGRRFNFKDSGWLIKGNITPPYRSYFMHYALKTSVSSATIYSWENGPNATYPPLLNAWEFFRVKDGLVNGTNNNDVEGLKSLQDRFVQLQPWSGDPCLPVGFSWEWLNCSSGDSPRVTNL